MPSAQWLCGTLTNAFISGAVRKNPRTKEATDKEIEDNIKYWLKFAAERNEAKS